MRNYLLKSIPILGILGLLFFGGGCKNTKSKPDLLECKRIVDSFKNPIDTQATKGEWLSAPQIQEILNKKDLKLNINTPLSVFARKITAVSSEPLKKREVFSCASLFNKIYKKGVNSEINNIELRIKWTHLNQFLDLASIQTSDNIFVALYYVINDTNPNNKYFSYIITKARKVNEGGKDTIKPISTNDQGTFLMLNYSPLGNYFQQVTPDRFKYYHELYKDGNLQYNNLDLLGGPYTQQLRDLASMHPRISYHTGRNFYKFFSDNIFTNVNDVYVVFTNGAFHKEGVSIFASSPMLFFEEGTVQHLNDGDHYSPQKFRMKALDVGSLCPPECN